MSVNEIDINAVNARTQQNTAGTTPAVIDDTESVETVKEVANLIKGSFRWRMAHVKLKGLMLLESVVWTIMDILRAKRLQLVDRIYKATKK